MFELSGGGGTLNSDQFLESLTSNEYLEHKCWSPSRKGLWEKRSGFDPVQVSGGGDYAAITANETSGNALMAYKGTLASALTYKPYYGTDLTANNIRGISDGVTASIVDGGNSTIANAASANLSFSQVGDDLVFSSQGSGQVETLSGTVHTEITGKTATFAAGDATVTSISTALSAGEQTNIVGSYLINTGDSAATKAVYRVASVTSSTELELDRPFNGSNTGATKAFTIRPWAPLHVGSGSAFADATNGDANGYTTGYAWGRLLIGGTLEGSVRHPNRLRWSGVFGSDEGTAPFTGVFAFDDDGYLDLPASGGSIMQIVQQGDAVVVFQEGLMTVLYGSPEFNGSGSLDASTSFPLGLDFWGSAVSTPFGLFFSGYNASSRLWRWSGSGYPEPVNEDAIFNEMVNQGNFYIGYHNEKLFLSGASQYVYNIQTGEFTEQVAGTSNEVYKYVQRGHGSSGVAGVGGSEELVAFDEQKLIDIGLGINISSSGAGTYSSDTSEDDATADIIGKLQTGTIGPPEMMLRPERAYLTYQLDGAGSSYIELKVSMGIDNGFYDVWTSASTDFPETGGSTLTKRVEIGTIRRAAGMGVTLETKTSPASCKIVRLVIEGAVEGMGALVDYG